MAGFLKHLPALDYKSTKTLQLPIGCTHLRSELLSFVGGSFLVMTMVLTSPRVIRKGHRCDTRGHWGKGGEGYLL